MLKTLSAKPLGTTIVTDGMMLEVDGNKGVVRIV